VPRRKTGKKETPEYPSEILPEISVLLRAARPTSADIAVEPDARKRREKERNRDLATELLIKICREPESHGEIDRLDLFRAQMFCKDLRERNHDSLPKGKGGRSPAKHRRLLIAVYVREEIEADRQKWGRVERALKKVAERHSASERYVRNIYNDPDPEWRRTVKVELAWRKIDAGKG
jgi:hypothetical protein